jgi:hypothetical protein
MGYLIFPVEGNAPSFLPRSWRSPCRAIMGYSIFPVEGNAPSFLPMSVAIALNNAAMTEHCPPFVHASPLTTTLH